jgi:hypothetical protein
MIPMNKLQWSSAEDVPANAPEDLWVKVEYVLVGGNLRMKAIIRASMRRNRYGTKIDPDLQDLLNLNRNASVTEDWNPNDGKPLIHITEWTARVDETRPAAFSFIKQSGKTNLNG